MSSLEKQVKSCYQNTQKPGREKESGNTRIFKQAPLLKLYQPPMRKQDGNWARSEEQKAKTFAEHLSKVFKHNPREITQEEENTL